ncbi:MAG: aminotransferase class III-fold pyridoxal phosphate-dependent enzyme, partial [Lentisphaeria bacterium]
EQTKKSGALLIFDEVITGFRYGATSYGEVIGVRPDITCLGKIIGGGMPMAAFGGRREIMEKMAPLGNVYQAGTLSGNPVALSAGLKTLKMLRDKNPYEQMQAKAKRIEEAVNSLNLPVLCVRSGGLFTIFFTESKQAPKNLEDVKKCDTERFARYHRAMLDLGFYLSPSQFELGFTSAVQTNEQIGSFIDALRGVLKEVCK